MKTAMQLLFEEFEALSKVSKDAKDERTANLIDFLCERKQVALEKEKEQIIEFGYKCRNKCKKESKLLPQDIFNTTYNQNK